jgi:phage tail sheath gpL-like
MAISTAVSSDTVARVVGIKTAYRDLSGGAARILPQRIAVIGQGATTASYSTTKAQVFSANEVGSTYGYGSPLHLAVSQLLPVNGDGVGNIPVTVYPLEDDGSGVASSGSITPVITVAVTNPTNYQISVNNILSEAFTVVAADTVATITAKITTAINAVAEMPVVATDGTTVVDVDSKWKGASANDIVLAAVGPSGFIDYTLVQPTSGATNPDISAALAQIGGVWESLLLNCLDIADTTTLGLYQTWGDGRYDPLIAKKAVVFTGNTEATVATAVTVPDARKTDKINVQLVAPGSDDLPFVVAARQLARIAVRANSNPPFDYGSLKATGLTPGADGEQWSPTEREFAVKAGSSTTQVEDSVVNLSDTVTFYHPTGDPLPAYRFVVDIVKLMQIDYNVALIFKNDEWDGAPLVPDDQDVTNPGTKKPKMARSLVYNLIDSLALEAIISDPEFAKSTVQAEISATNPKRLDITFTVKLSGNTNVISIDFYFGFYFGTQEVAA